jgi:hypothetical protein
VLIVRNIALSTEVCVKRGDVKGSYHKEKEEVSDKSLEEVWQKG